MLSFNMKQEFHVSLLKSVIMEEENIESRLLYSYHFAIEGFAAHLSEQEGEDLRNTNGVIAVRRDHRLDLQTTYSYKFLGLNPNGNGAWVESKFGQGTIVGVLDTGIWPESPSFYDHGMPPVPKRWRGECEVGERFNSSLCNRKLIGARFYDRGHRAAMGVIGYTGDEYVSPRDAHGHGTHTSSTAAGNSVPSASVLGNGAGEARGMATAAHVAMYKVCWSNGCYSSDVLAGIDDAIGDGVDILSLSLGSFPIPLYDDNIAIGSFQATERGILVTCAAGNNGPIPSSVTNEAPWIITVGAGSVDRRFPAIVRLGNGRLLYGESMFPGNRFSKKGGKSFELVYENGGKLGGEFCFSNSLSKERITGKMVVCDRGTTGRVGKGEVVKEAGGAAMILANTEENLEEDSVDVHVLPATLVGFRESLVLKDYIKNTIKPTARILFGGTLYGRSRAPMVALFSSRGPSLNNPSILKPDVIAPGVNIIAAWPQNLGPTGLLEDSRRVNFTVLSGTSMACPHVSGIAALIRSKHPSWSPAAVKSAIMTTADVYDHFGKPIMDNSKPAGLFAMGAGYVNPAKAIDPGLVYDINPADYITHLCTLGYTRAEIFTITHKNVNCHEIMANNRGFSLNYPSISVIFNNNDLRSRKMVIRRLTNVGLPNSTYTVEVVGPRGVEVRVEPRKLTFEYLNESKIFRIWFASKRSLVKGKTLFDEGHLIWVHQNHLYNVRSPISMTWAG